MRHGAIEWVDIPARDLAASVRFYETVFGWKINRERGWEEYPMFKDAGDFMGGGFVKTEKPAAEGGTVLYISVTDIDAMLPKILEAGGRSEKPKTLIHESVGWWSTFRDPAGNLVGLYQSVK